MAPLNLNHINNILFFLGDQLKDKWIDFLKEIGKRNTHPKQYYDHKAFSKKPLKHYWL